MKNWLLPLAALALSMPALAQEEAPPKAEPAPDPAPGPSDIINAAPQSDWSVIAPEDLLVMTLAPDSDGNAREVIIQLMPAPFSQGWVSNIRTLARAEWYDGTSVNRVQDNYVVQWGDPNYDNPEAGGKAKPLPEGLKVMEEADYTSTNGEVTDVLMEQVGQAEVARLLAEGADSKEHQVKAQIRASLPADPYAQGGGFLSMGWPMASGGRELESAIWPVHCYGMVGVGRNYSPDTGSGAELYAVIGHAPRHLDRNIALVGRIIEGMEHLSSLPRGKGALGFYTKEEADKRTPILSIRVASDLPESERPQFEYLSTETESFARYAEARANRRDPFFIVPAGGADICNIPVPIRAFEYAD
jgi:cyclophilin family peptidyl-prolyl cis-trans isomerase